MKTAWVVGASSALGGPAARRLRRDGYTVVGFSRTEPVSGTVDAHLPCDVTDVEAVAASIATALAAHEAPSVLVYAAGYPAMGATLAVPGEAARTAFAVNFWGLEAFVRGVLPTMLASGRGTVVALLSIAAHRAIAHEAYYAASKAAALRWLDCVAMETRPRGVHVRHVSPGFIDTGFFDRQGWFGVDVPEVRGSGTTPEDVADEVWAIVGGKPSSVLGWRERTILWADRVAPGIYDAVLRRRHR